MSDTYSQINLYAIFAVESRACLLRNDDFRQRLFEYIGGILKQKGCYPLAVGGYHDHVHIFFEMPPRLSPAEVIRDVKRSSSNWIDSQNIFMGKFCWQTGYGIFSYSKSQRSVIIDYISGQVEHHRIKTFKEEYLTLLQKADLPFSDQRVFKWIDLSDLN